jgi:hypothetical protein
MSIPKIVHPPVLLVYLDLDGVVHHEAVMWHARRGIYMCPKEAQGHELFEWLGHLEAALLPYPDVKLVLSSSWCITPGFSSTLRRLPMPLQNRFIGGTFHRRHHGADSWAVDKFKSIPRGLQVLADVQRRKPADWLAIDDDAVGWPSEARENLVHCDCSTGLSSPTVQAELKEKLERKHVGIAESWHAAQA